MKILFAKYHVLFIFSILISNFFISCKDNEKESTPKEEIPNSNFEQWTVDNEFNKPTDWNTSSFSLYNIVRFETVFKDSLESFTGSFCPKLETKGQIINNELVKVAGLITLGNFDINIASKQAKISGGTPFISRPISLKGYYKYNGINNDKCFIDIALTKYNNKQDTIAQGRFSSNSVSEWTFFEFPLQYLSNDIPDSLNIVILSSDTSIFEVGSTLWIDDLDFTY